MDLIDEALAEDEIRVREVGQSLQENHSCNVNLEGAWIQLVPGQQRAKVKGHS